MRKSIFKAINARAVIFGEMVRPVLKLILKQVVNEKNVPLL